MRYVAAYDAYFEMKKGGETDHLDYHVKGGNSKITEKLWCEVGKRNVRLGEEVTTIVDKDGVVSVGTAKKTYVAKKVLMTASVKTFKNIEISPALKEKKTVARNLTYGDITKAFVSFSGCVPFKKQDFSMVYENDIQYIYLASQGQSENRFALCIYAVGPAAKKIYKMKSEVLTKKVKALLPADVFDVNSLVLSEVVVQNWGSEIFTGGGYCIFNPSEHKEVRAPPHGNIHFAGDYLGISFNYMNGAFQSGRDEMRRIKTGL
jgi:monoamine oxidase